VGVVTDFAVPNQAYGITPGPDGNLWYTTASGVVGRMTTSGTITEFASGPADYDSGIAPGSDGSLWYTHPHSDGVARISTSRD